MGFKEWLLKEVGTSTGDIAGFRRISIPMWRRMWPPMVSTMFEEDPPKKEKQPKKQPQVQENVLANIDSIAQKIVSGNAQEPMVRQWLGQLIDVLSNDNSTDDPYVLNMEATVRENILPYIARFPQFRREYDLLQALTSA